MLLSDLFHELSETDRLTAPDSLQALLNEPLDVTRDWGRAEHLLLSAQAQLPDRLEISVALYKMYAYTNRHHEALTLIDAVLSQAAQRAGFDPSDGTGKAPSGPFTDATGDARHYLYALKAKAFVLLRRGDVDRAFNVLDALQSLDPWDQVGGSVVRDMAVQVRAAKESPLN